MNFKNDFSWSFSRNNTFKECLRKYYYNYYFYWGGWDHNAKERIKLTYRLKQLTNYYMYKGTVVHECIEQILPFIQRSVEINFDYQDWINKKIEKDMRDSQSLQFIGNPKRNICLEEHYYFGADSIEKSKIMQLKIDVKEQVDNLINSDIFDRIKQAKEIISIDKLDEIYINNVKVYIKIDLLYRSKTGNIIIMDWKTGKQKDIYEEQLGVYALFAKEKFPDEFKNNKIAAMDVYLQKPDLFSLHKIKEDHTSKALKTIKQSSKKMMDLLEDENENIPMHSRHFEKISDNPDVAPCFRCKFKELCYGSR